MLSRLSHMRMYIYIYMYVCKTTYIYIYIYIYTHAEFDVPVNYPVQNTYLTPEPLSPEHSTLRRVSHRQGCSTHRPQSSSFLGFIIL